MNNGDFRSAFAEECAALSTGDHFSIFGERDGALALCKLPKNVRVQEEYRKYKAIFHARPPSGVSQHPASAHPAPLGATPQPPPEHQLGSLVGSQQVAEWRQ